MIFKNIFWLLLIFIINTLPIKAQQLGISQFNLPSARWDAATNTLTLNRGTVSQFFVTIGASRPNLPEWTNSNLSFEMEVEVFVQKNDGTAAIKVNDDSIRFVTSDFIDESSVTQVKFPNLTIPANYITDAGGVMTVRFRYLKQNYPLPDNADGWTEWYTANTNINLKLEVPETTITGPDQICSEGTYTLTNPGTITLENANGIATLTALGNNQWKVTRIGSGAGSVILRSTVGDGIIYNKYISVNSDLQGTFTGNAGIKQGMNNISYTFTPATGKTYSNYSWTIDTGGLTVVPNGNKLTISVPRNYQLIDGYNGDVVFLTVKAQGECGLMTKTMQVIIIPAVPIAEPL